MFDAVAKELQTIRKDGIPLQHKFDLPSAGYIAGAVFVGVFFAMFLALFLYSKMPKN